MHVGHNNQTGTQEDKNDSIPGNKTRELRIYNQGVAVSYQIKRWVWTKNASCLVYAPQGSVTGYCPKKITLSVL